MCDGLNAAPLRDIADVGMERGAVFRPPRYARSQWFTVSVLLIALITASCGGSSSPDPLAAVTTASPATTAIGITTSSVATEPAPVPAVVFDGASCLVEGGPLDPGLAQISVLNTSSHAAAALSLKLNETYRLDDVAGDVASGRFDRWRLAGNDDPTGWEELNDALMPPFASEPILQPFTATSGIWAVVCLDSLEEKAYIGSGVIEVG